MSDDDDFDQSEAPFGARRAYFGLSDLLFDELLRDFEAHGKAAIAAFREKFPAAYLRLVAEVEGPEPPPGENANELSETQVVEALNALRLWLDAEDERTSAAARDEG